VRGDVVAGYLFVANMPTGRNRAVLEIIADLPVKNETDELLRALMYRFMSYIEIQPQFIGWYNWDLKRCILTVFQVDDVKCVWVGFCYNGVRVVIDNTHHKTNALFEFYELDIEQLVRYVLDLGAKNWESPLIGGGW
jgi:hypothetical protein